MRLFSIFGTVHIMRSCIILSSDIRQPGREGGEQRREPGEDIERESATEQRNSSSISKKKGGLLVSMAA